ncbi:SPFH domain-containing protein [Paenibacillus sp. GCM10012303]|jgi:flotillin|uniref:SPFH domain-containing protein n=1 Tax=Paenibacillus sp. GCM10012303 TaxID=3317340 RepID=UPI00360CF1BB
MFELSSTLILGGIGVAVLIVAVLVFINRYRTVSSNEAMIVTGNMLGSRNIVESENQNGGRIKIIKGGGALVLPVVQVEKRLSLKSHMIEVRTPEVYTEEGVPVQVDATALIKVGSMIEDIAKAAERYLDKSDEVLKLEAGEVLEGHLRSILGSMTVEEIYKNRDKFAQDVQAVAVVDLKKMGLAIDSFTIKDVRDKHEYLASLGKPRIAQVKRDADIAEAEALQQARVKKAEAEQIARQAELEREAKIEEATKDRNLKVSQFKEESDKAKAKADVAYSVQKAVSDREAVEAEMQVQKIKLERETELAEKQVALTTQKLEAEVKVKADAEVYERSQKAEAAKIEQERQAEADATKRRLQAEAESKAKELEGKAEAEVTKAKGLAEAASTREKGSAEADVAQRLAQVEVEKEMGLADAALKLGQLRYVELITAVLPEVAGKIAEPMANIDKLTIIDANGNGEAGSGMGKVTSQVTNLMKFLPEVVNDMTGIKLGDVLAHMTNGRVGQTGEFDPNSIAQLLKQAKGVDPQVLSLLLQSAGISGLTGTNSAPVMETSSSAAAESSSETEGVGSEPGEKASPENDK